VARPSPPAISIVAEIEKQFTRLDDAIAALKRVQANLKRYRASVLKAACEGRLVPTEAELAPTEGRDCEPASELLKRILVERRAKWEADQLQKMIAAGKPPKDHKWKQKFEVPLAPNAPNLPALPTGWAWASTAQLGEVQLGRQRSPKNRSKDYPTKYIRAANITERGLDLSDVLDMDFEPREHSRYQLEDGDLVLSEASGSPTQVGKPAVWRGEIPNCCFQNTVIRLRQIGCDADYLLVALRNYYENGFFARLAGGVGINHLGAEKFSVVPIPVPPISE
jgi:type I restriction enzyme S subunit